MSLIADVFVSCIADLYLQGLRTMEQRNSISEIQLYSFGMDENPMLAKCCRLWSQAQVQQPQDQHQCFGFQKKRFLLGYFHPENIFSDNENKQFSG